MAELSEQERARIALIGGLVQGIGGGEKGQTVEGVAKQLGLSESSVKRLMRQWQAEGIAGLVRQVRSDCPRARCANEGSIGFRLSGVSTSSRRIERGTGADGV
ncbi:MAG: helix-turn-helix domain-containing protein [Cyanobacteria bacterium RM1_2_2]|nr:helix-turn-helix domain-containing protein [Cyanobacteria bacterium RM1_2_2]